MNSHIRLANTIDCHRIADLANHSISLDAHEARFLGARAIARIGASITPRCSVAPTECARLAALCARTAVTFAQRAVESRSEVQS